MNEMKERTLKKKVCIEYTMCKYLLLLSTQEVCAIKINSVRSTIRS